MNNLELTVPLPLPLGGSPGMPSPALAEVAVCGFCEFSIFSIHRQCELRESEFQSKALEVWGDSEVREEASEEGRLMLTAK